MELRSMEKQIEKQIEGFQNLILDMRTNSSVQKVKNCYFRRCAEDDYLTIMDIQNRIMEDLKKSQNENLFISSDNNEIKQRIGQDDTYFICVQTPNGICAYSCTLFSDKYEYDLSRYFANKKVATFDMVVVLPEFRGNGLQRMLFKASEKEAERRGFEVIASTVSPDNIYSLNNFIEDGFKILKTVKHGNNKRNIMYKNVKH